MKKEIGVYCLLFCLCLGTAFGQQKQLDSLESALRISREDTVTIHLLIQLSKGYLGKDKKRSLEFAQRAKQTVEKTNRFKWKSAAFQNMARYWKIEGKDSLAQSEAEKALIMARKSGNLTEISNCLGLLSSIAEKKNIEKVIPLMEEKIAIDYKIGDPQRLSQSHLVLGDKLRAMAKNDLALAQFNQAYEILVKAGLKEKTGRALQGIAGQNYILGYYQTSVQMLLEAIRLNTTQKDLIAVGDNYNLMGIVYRKKGPVDSAIYWYSKCIGHFNQINERGRTQYPLNNLGNIYQDLKQYDKAIDYRRKSLEVYKETDQKGQMGNTYVSLALTYLDMKLWEKALLTMDTAYTLQKKYGVEREARRQLFQIRQKVYEQTGKLDSSLFYYKQYINIRDSIYGKESTEKMEKLKLEFETREKEQKIALLEKENTVKSELAQKQELLLQVARLSQAKSKSEKERLEEKIISEKTARLAKEKELDLERLNEKVIRDQMVSEQQKQVILSKEKQLAEVELEKEKLLKNFLLLIASLVVGGAVLVVYKIRINQQKAKIATLTRISRDLHDNIGSTLGSISVYSEMARKMKDSKPEMVGEMLQKIQENSRESVDMMSDIVWSLNPANETLEQLMMRLKNYATDILVSQAMEVVFEMDDTLASVKTNLEHRTNLFLLLKEALFNASKYSKASRVIVRCKSGNKLVIWEVEDNGIGFSTADIDASRNGNGLRNMKLRAEEIGGKLRIDSQRGKGTKVIAEFS